MRLRQETVVLFLLLLASAIFAWRFFTRFERDNLYFPDRAMSAHPGTYGLAYEELRLMSSGGSLVHGWFIGLSESSPVILLSHGNAGNISHRLEKAVLLRKAGASVLLYDYQGYGRSEGVPSEKGSYADAAAAYAWLIREKKVPPHKIFFYGESLGAGPSIELAASQPAAGLILESAFSSVPDMAKVVFPGLPLEWLIRFRYDNLAKIGKIRCPLLVMHSPQDEIVPYSMGRRLFENAPQPKSFFDLKGDHNGGFLISGEAYVEALRRFLSTINRSAIK